MFAKLFARITESSLMEEDIPVRYTFVMMLAIADAEGDVIGTDIAIARRLNMPVNEFQRCVGVLSSPDPSSNSKDMEGRRVIPGDSERGYKVVNYIKYRELTTEFQKKTYMRRYMREYREKGKVENDDVKLTKSYRKTELNTLDTPSLTSASASVSSSQGKESAERKGSVTQAVVTTPLQNVIYHWDSRTVLHLLNEATGRNFRELASNLEVISARLQEPGVTLGGVRKMIARQCARWKGTTQEEFLRPETLFGKTKFDSYYAAGDLPISTDQPGAKPKQESIIDKQIKSLCSPR